MLPFTAAMRLLDRHHGEKVPIKWFRCVGRCPCYDRERGSHDLAHALCRGTGLLREEVDVSHYTAIITGWRAGRRNDHQVGQLQDGDLLASTWPQEIPLAENDRVVIPSRTTTYSEVITRGSGATDALMQPNVTEIERVADTDGAVTTGFSLVSGAVEWLAGAGVTVGERYTVRYRYQPEFQVVSGSVLQRMPDATGPLPQCVALRIVNPNQFD